MRQKSSLIRRGFTLIELLTVIAIIGILAGMVVGIVQVVKKQARIASSKQMFSQWASAVEQYKVAYNTYPALSGSNYESAKDTIYSLDNTGTVSDFIKCLTGRNPIFDGGTPLSTGNGGDARKFNRQNREFASIDPAAFEKDSTGNYTRKLTDAFGNTNIRLVMDTDGNGMVKPTDITGTPSDYGIDTQGFIGNKVIIYTLKSDNKNEFEDVLSWQ